jgi:hypothetical protein
MRVLSELTDYEEGGISTEQLPRVVPSLVPELRKVFLNQERDLRTRSRAVAILKALLNQLHDISAAHPEVDAMVEALLGEWMQPFIQVLGFPDGPTVDIGLKAEILETISLIIKGCVTAPAICRVFRSAALADTG